MPQEREGPPFNPENFVKIAADNIGQLRRCDVDRVLSTVPPEHFQAMSDYIVENRIDLVPTVLAVTQDLRPELIRAGHPDDYDKTKMTLDEYERSRGQ
jgi:hypothetical protein